MLRAVLSVACVLVPVAMSAGAIHVESPDAGELLPTSQLVGPGVDQIYGSISPLGDIDLYCLEFDVTATVHISSTKPGDWFDEDWTVFNANGNPILVADPAAFDLAVTPGTYYLALGDWNIYATDAAGTMIADDHEGVLNTSAVLGGWVANTTPLRGGDYIITLSVPTAPEPATLVLLALGGLPLLRRRRA